MKPWTRVIPWGVLVDGPVLNVQLPSHVLLLLLLFLLFTLGSKDPKV